MDVTITDNELDITVSADTDKQARNLMKAARRKAAAAQAVKDHNRDIARLYACKSAFHVYERMAQDKTFPNGWRYVENGASYFPPRVDCELCYNAWSVDSERGRATLKIYDAYKLVGIVENGAGYPMLAFIDENGDAPTVYAIGVYESEVVLERISAKLAPDQFRQSAS